MKYFKDIKNLDELRKQYKTLLKRFHPDNVGGSEEITKAVNTEYEALFKKLKNHFEANAKGVDKESQSFKKYDFAEDEKLREVLRMIIHLADIEIEICGQWIWVGGNTYPHKDYLRNLKFKFAGNKKRWYWHSEAFRKKGKKPLSMEEIRNLYGKSDIKKEEEKYIATQ